MALLQDDRHDNRHVCLSEDALQFHSTAWTVLEQQMAPNISDCDAVRVPASHKHERCWLPTHLKSASVGAPGADSCDRSGGGYGLDKRGG